MKDASVGERSTIKDECATAIIKMNEVRTRAMKDESGWRKRHNLTECATQEAQSRMNVLQQDQDVCATEKGNEE